MKIGEADSRNVAGGAFSAALRDAIWAIAARVRFEADSLKRVPLPPRSEDPFEALLQRANLQDLAEMVERCRRCNLGALRKRPVLGEGVVRPLVMFVGEAPGAEEDESGRPFVGKAGQLLSRMIVAMKMERARCYITNVVKCRPPNNATPTREQMSACMPYLRRQIQIVRPGVMVALGRVAGMALTDSQDTVGKMRGKWHLYGDIPFVVTYHPSALLRWPQYKKAAWEDLKMVMRRLEIPTD